MFYEGNNVRGQVDFQPTKNAAVVNSYITTVAPVPTLALQDDPLNPTFTEIPIQLNKRWDKLLVSGVQCHSVHTQHSAAQGK